VIQISLKSDKNIRYSLHEDRRTFTIKPRSILFRMIYLSDKSCRENRNTILC